MHAARLFPLLFLALTTLAGPLAAQPPAPLPPSRAPALDPIVARALTRAALVDLRSASSPGPDDYRIAASLLRSAADLDPADLDILHLTIEAVRESGDQAGVLQLLKRLHAADREDTTAQLDLIEALAATKDKVEDRIAMYEQILGAQGQNLDPAVRSRVALRAAGLHRDLGATEKFKQHLAAALQLDSSNTAAATLAVEYYTAAGGDRSGRVELLVNLLKANPLDPRTHLALAREFSAAGAPDAALRFYENARLLAARIGSPLPTPDQADRVVQTWKKLGAAPAVKELNDALDGARRNAEVERALALGRHDPVDQLPNPANMRLPLELESIRLAAALAAGDMPTVERSVPDFAASLDSERARRALSPEVLTAIEHELAFVRGWTGLQPVFFQDVLARLRADQTTPPEVLARLEAWAKLRAGDRAGARAAFAALHDDGLAGLAVAHIDAEAPEPPADLDARLARLAVDYPSSPLSAWATSVYSRRTGVPPPPSPAAERFAAMAAGIPAWIDALARDPWHDVVVVAITPNPNVGPLEPATVTLKIRNNSPVPLAFGPNREPQARFDNPISSEFLLMTVVDAGGAKLHALGGAEPISMWRRLRIMPRQEVSLTFWADPGSTGWAAESALSSSLRYRWHMIQGFQIRDGVPSPGLLGSSFDLGPIFRAGVGPADIEALVAQVTSARDGDLARAVLASRQALLAAGTSRGLNADSARRLVSTLGERYKKESRLGKLAILLYTPGPRLSTATADLDRVLAETPETDPLVARVALLTRADDAASPILAAARNSADADVRAFAELIARRLATPANTFARLKSFSVLDITGIPPGPKPEPGAETPPAAPSAPPSTPPAAAPTPPVK